MNKYIIPICDIENSKVYIKLIIAKSTSECQEKLMSYLINTYNIDDTSLNYREFINLIDTKYNILVGKITDSEEI